MGLNPEPVQKLISSAVVTVLLDGVLGLVTLTVMFVYSKPMALMVLAISLTGCATSRLPRQDAPPAHSYAWPAAEDGFLDEYGDRIEAGLGEGESAYWLLDRGDLALKARLAVTDLAVSSLDIQYFIWEADETGRLLAQRVIRAADRGVRVRLLIDDILLTRRDSEIAGLAYHFRPSSGQYHHRLYV